MMLAFTQNWFGLPLWAWLLIVVAVIVVVAIVIARKMEFEGVNLTATPPFVTFRFKRKPTREQTRQVSREANLTGLSAPIRVNTADGDAQISTGAGARNIQTQGASYIEYAETVITAPPERAPRGSAVPPLTARRFVSRGKIMDDLRAALQTQTHTALVGVGGMGGVGKSELAKFICHEIEAAQPGRVLWVQVGDRSLALVHGEMARALGVTFPPNADAAACYATLCAVLRDSPRVLVFDDVPKAFIPSLKFVLPPPPCGALVTSRQRELGLPMMFELDVMTPDESLELLRGAPALADALAREPDAARELCRLCGYLPLALDIAARRLEKRLRDSTAPVAAFNRILANRLKELATGAPPTRENSIIANLDLSYADLEEEDRARFRKLAVFAPSGFAPRAAGAVWGEDAETARNGIERLQNASLVTPAAEVGRFRMHDLIRDYAAEKLREARESDAANRAHAEFLIALFQKHEMDDLSTAPEVGNELENLREAAKWAREQGEGELLARLATVPRNWLMVLNIWDEWLRWLSAALRVADRLSPQLQANVRKAMGDIQQFRKENDAALQNYAAALELYRAVGARVGEANVRKAMGDIQQFRDERDAALQNYAAALELYRAVGDRLGEANVLAALCRLDLQAGNLAKAERSLEQVIAIRREIGDLYSEGADFGNFALALLRLGEKAKAKMYALRAKAVFEQIGEPSLIQQVDRLIAACE